MLEEAHVRFSPESFKRAVDDAAVVSSQGCCWLPRHALFSLAQARMLGNATNFHAHRATILVKKQAAIAIVHQIQRVYQMIMHHLGHRANV